MKHFMKKEIVHRLHKLTQIIKIKKIRVICITILQSLVFIPRFFLRHLRIPAAIIGWGCHPLCGLIKKRRTP
jgi:hypothetical protein